MKTLTFLITAIILSFMANAQSKNLPKTELRTIDGNLISSSGIVKPNTTTILVFWDANSSKCCDNLDSLQCIGDEILQNKGIKIITICVDCNGTWSSVKPVVMGRGWEFETFIDVNNDLKRAMNINQLPCTILIDKNQNMICSYEGYLSKNK